MNNLSLFVSEYRNNAAGNDSTHQLFTQKTNEISFLKNHRDYIEQHKLGFGDRAFHFMWYLLFNEVAARGQVPVRALEIGVYKGQVISLWALLSRQQNVPAEISAISPLEGTLPSNSVLNSRVVKKIRRIFSPSFRKQEKEGNLYLNEDYKKIISDLFSHFDLDFGKIKLHKGYSNDQGILEAVKGKRFDLIYIDGDHSYEGALNDIKNYSPLVNDKGYLVMDDASWFLEGTTFWKGHAEVSRASEIIESLGFRNILNVGHNRVYQKN